MGQYAIMTMTMITREVPKFIFVYFCIWAPYTLAFYFNQNPVATADDLNTSWAAKFKQTVQDIFGSWMGGLAADAIRRHTSGALVDWFGVILFVTWIILSSILLVNLVVAMLVS